MSDNAELENGQEVKTTFVLIGGVARPVQYTVVDGSAVVEGCIILGSAEEAENSLKLVQDMPGLLRSDAETFGSGILGENYRWPDATLVYEINASVPHPEYVHEAMAEWTAKTAVRFVQRNPADPAHANYVEFVGGSGCSSAVGMRGGRQKLTLGPNCTRGNAIHEIGHALGLWHEQSRIDRDAHVRIIWNRIQPGTEHNFSQHIHDGIDLGAYDPGSIMHYPLNAFSTDSTKPTIEMVKPFGGVVGQRDGLSQGDRDAIKILYPNA